MSELDIDAIERDAELFGYDRETAAKFHALIAEVRQLRALTQDMIPAYAQFMLESCRSHGVALSFAEWLAAQSTEPRWIPVTERLPEDGVEVLGFDGSAYWLVLWNDPLLGSGQWTEQCQLDSHDVTHWQPLPQPPKEKL